MDNTLTVSVIINAPVDKVWAAYNTPEDIQQWNQASEDWHCPASENDLRTGGRFKNTMAAKDGSFSFDFSGTYTDVTPHTFIAYTMDDDRKATVKFEAEGETTVVTTTFEPEGTNPTDMQQQGWQAILNSFKNYAESK